MQKKDTCGEGRAMFAISSYYKAIMFFASAKLSIRRNELFPAVICAYYSIFHLSVSRIKLFKGYVFKKEQELCKPSDPQAKKLTHKKVQKLVTTLVKQKKLPKSYLKLLQSLEEMRVYVNYGPRLYKEKEGGYIFDSNCSYPCLRIKFLIALDKLEKEFINFVDSMRKISHNPYRFTKFYVELYFGEFDKISAYSKNTLDFAKRFHNKLYSYYEKEEREKKKKTKKK